MTGEFKALNMAVTAAIFKAEDLDRDAARAWHVVAEVEKQIAEHDETPPVQRELAERGVVTARARSEYLRRGSRMFEEKIEDLAYKVALLVQPEGQDHADFLKTVERARLLVVQVLRS